MKKLAVFGLLALVVLAGAAWLLRGRLMPLAGMNVDTGAGGRAELELPAGFEASVFAESLSGPRFMAVSPDGVLFVAERGADRVVALPDRDGDGRADDLIEVGQDYGDAHDIEFAGDGSLLVAGESTLYRVTLDPEGLTERDRAAVVDDLPTGGQHTTRTVVELDGGELLVSVGSSCDVCVEEDPRRGAVSLVTPDGEQRLYMTGLRNAVGLWVDDETGRAWATNMGRDMLGDDLPPETLYEVVDGADAGWPACHAGEVADPEFGTDGAMASGSEPVGGETKDPCAGVAQPATTFQAHMAPLALLAWEDHLVIAFHGSWNRSAKVGYALWWLPWDGEPAGDAEPFATGFLPEGAQEALGRPAGLAVGPDGALYVSDDKAGFIYRISRE